MVLGVLGLGRRVTALLNGLSPGKGTSYASAETDVTMKASYLNPTLMFALGLGLLIFGTSGSEAVTFLGLMFHPRVAKGLGIIALIFSEIIFLVAWSDSQPPSHTGHRG
jgi:hypothetical protein